MFVLSLPLHAQDLEGFIGMRLRLEAPGARAAGMGGATEALDSTFTGITNPAALARIHERRIAVEARGGSDATEYIDGGRVGAFTTMQLQTRQSGIRSAIVTIPTRRATWAFFADEPLHAASPTTRVVWEGNSVIHVGMFGGQLVPVEDCQNFPRERPNQGGDPCPIGTYNLPIALPATSNVALRRLGTALGWSTGPLSFGGSIEYAHLRQQTNLGQTTTHASSDSDFTWSAGAQWQVTPTIHTAASYRSGARFESQRTVHFQEFANHEAATFNTPESYGGGVALDVAPNLTVAIDARRVRYSQMLNGLPQPYIDTAVQRLPIVMPDVTELHTGAEYRLGQIALRAGWWRDPSHRLRVLDGDAVVPQPYDVIIPAAYFNLMLLDEDEDHVTAGIGFGRTIRVDAAVDRSQHTTRGSLTVATKF